MNILYFTLNKLVNNIVKKQESRGTVISVIDGAVLISDLKCVKSEETFDFMNELGWAVDENMVLLLALNANAKALIFYYKGLFTRSFHTCFWPK